MRRIAFSTAVVAALVAGAGVGFTQGGADAAAKAPFTRHFQQRNVGPGELLQIVVPCPVGTVPTGGGFNTAADGGVVVQSSFSTPSGWEVWVRNTTNVFKSASANAICSVP
ncbi:hypothetical protein ACFYYS_17800 [Streptomyces sp. NPDC002120]|uniref:hypothetical protein n=1 Tax=Streptomyces sp. NPDC002120 TaxID=3364631 RepID=UPI0036CBD698